MKHNRREEGEEEESSPGRKKAREIAWIALVVIAVLSTLFLSCLWIARGMVQVPDTAKSCADQQQKIVDYLEIRNDSLAAAIAGKEDPATIDLNDIRSISKGCRGEVLGHKGVQVATQTTTTTVKP